MPPPSLKSDLFIARVLLPPPKTSLTKACLIWALVSCQILCRKCDCPVTLSLGLTLIHTQASRCFWGQPCVVTPTPFHVPCPLFGNPSPSPFSSLHSRSPLPRTRAPAPFVWPAPLQPSSSALSAFYNPSKAVIVAPRTCLLLLMCMV